MIIINLENVLTDLLSELAKREREAGIFPEAEVDLFMKVINKLINGI